MAHQRIGLALALVLAAILWTGSTAESDCNNVQISLAPCVSFITGNSSTPSSTCCTPLGSVVKTRPECLCEVLNGSASSLGLQINQTQAEALPAACNVQAPTVSSCNTPPTGSSNTPSKATPSGTKTDKGSSDGSSENFAAPLLFFLIFVGLYASTFTM